MQYKNKHIPVQNKLFFLHTDLLWAHLVLHRQKRSSATVSGTGRFFTEAATGRVLSRKVFLKISQISQENTYTRVSFLIKLLVEACFPVKFSRTPFLQNTSGRIRANFHINPFFPSVLFFYPRKTSENRNVSCFQGLEKGVHWE